MTSTEFQNGSPTVDDGGPPSKRRRVALACNACRTRKSRCNGERPKCSLCRNLGFDCQYEPTDSSTNVIVKKEYVSDFETRLKYVEEMLKRHDGLLVGHLSACAGISRPELPTSTPSQEHETPRRDFIARESIHLDASELQDLPAEEMVTDGMAMSFVNESDSAFFGASSNIHFTRHILGAMTSRNITQPKTMSIRGSLMNSGILDYSRPPTPTSPSAPPRSVPAVLELPSVTEMERLIRKFFQNTGVLFPFVHESSFMETYNSFKASNFSKVRRTWLGLLNVVLAMGSSYDPEGKLSAARRAEKSHVFYQRARNLCMKASVRGASLDIVQYLLLASQYLQSTQKSSQTWSLHGLAVKGAFALGLHSNQASQRFSPLESEMRKRTWYGCVLLDRVLSMTFGRPPCIHEEFVNLPLALPWPVASGTDALMKQLETPSMDFYNASITLHRLIGSTVARLYGQNISIDSAPHEAELAPRIMELEQQLRTWQSTLPSALPMVFSSSVPSPKSDYERAVARFRCMLTLRYHNLHILVHRPLLCDALDNLAFTTATPFLSAVSPVTRNSIVSCLGSAEETINIVHATLTDPTRGLAMLGAWWFTLFYSFNASLVVFANSLIQRSTLQQPTQNLTHNPSQDVELLSRVIEFFRLLDNDNRIVDRCTEYLQYLLRVLERWNQRDHERRTASMNAPPNYHLSPGNSAALPQAPGPADFKFDALPDLGDFLKDDLELAQFFASGIFDMQNSSEGALWA